MNKIINMPKIAVLMATHNGEKWVNEQIISILNQENVNITIFVSDDFSTDKTFTILKKLSKRFSQIVLLPRLSPMGSPAKNFYYLLSSLDLSSFNYVSLADQDDIWMKNKLTRHVSLLKKNNVEGVSSNVIAFWKNGKEKLINKSQYFNQYDFIFESAGPGATYTMSIWLTKKVQELLLHNKTTKDIIYHDWLIYAICRSCNKKWFIDKTPSLYYRQHSQNVVGANVGFFSLIKRLNKIANGLYRNEVRKIIDIAVLLNKNKDLIFLQKIINNYSFSNQLCLIIFALKGRRSLIDRFYLTFVILFFIF